MLEDNSDKCTEVSTRIDRVSIFVHQQLRHKTILLYVSASINSILDQQEGGVLLCENFFTICRTLICKDFNNCELINVGHAASHIGSVHVNNTRTTTGSFSKIFN